MRWIEVCFMLVMVAECSVCTMQTILDIKVVMARQLQQAYIHHEHWNQQSSL